MGDYDFIKEFAAKPSEDSNQFEPVAGGYLGIVTKAEKVTGEKDGKPYAFHALSIVVTETKDGDQAVGRYLSKTYNTINPSEYSEPMGEKKKLLTDLVTMGIEIPKTLNNDEAFDMLVGTAKDKPVCCRAWKTKGGKQACKIVKEIKVRKPKKVVAAAEAPAEF